MSESGHTRTSANVCSTTASPPKAEMPGSPSEVAEGPEADESRTSCASESLEGTFHPRLDDDGSPLLNLGFHLVAELVGPQKLRLHTLHAQPLARVGCIDGLVQQSVDARDQSGRRGSGREHAEPCDIFITGKTRFRDGGHTWKLRRALKARYTQGTQAACADRLDRARHRRQGKVHVSGD